jgi:general stress protein 26
LLLGSGAGVGMVRTVILILPRLGKRGRSPKHNGGNGRSADRYHGVSPCTLAEAFLLRSSTWSILDLSQAAHPVVPSEICAAEDQMADHDIERVWQHSRPMGAFVRPEEGAIYFFTDERAHKDEQIRQYPRVSLAFADTGGQKYLSVSGTAEISSDREKIEDLWAIPAKVWWKTPDNPNIRLIKVTPIEAEYWDAPGNLVSSFSVAFALATGGYPQVGEHKKVDL